MKPTTLFTALTLVLASAADALTSHKAASSTSRLAPQPSDSPKNFTFSQLYDLQVRFLDNFLYPKNAIQVSCTLRRGLPTV